MKEEIYDYLRKYGFSKEELKEFENKNEKMYFTSMKEVQKNISFLISKGLSKEETINVIRVNPYMLTVKDNRLNALENIYKEVLELSSTSIKDLLILNPNMFTESPIELQKIIDNLKEKNYETKLINNIIINDPKLLDLTLEEFKKTIDN